MIIEMFVLKLNRGYGAPSLMYSTQLVLLWLFVSLNKDVWLGCPFAPVLHCANLLTVYIRFAVEI